MARGCARVPAGRLGKLTQGCPNIDVNEADETAALYSDYLTTSSASEQAALLDQATQELGTHVDIDNILQSIISDPSAFANGEWGIAHGVVTYLAMQAVWAATGDTTLVQAEADRQLAYWYSREAIARCRDGVADWYAPVNWYEDSRLDYMTPLILANQFMDSISTTAPDCCAEWESYFATLGDGVLTVNSANTALTT